MIKKTLTFAALSLLLANVAMAGEPLTAVPLEDGGILALAAGCLIVGIRIIRRKRDR